MTSKQGLCISILIRAIPAFLIYLGLLADTMNIYTVISHGLIMSILTGDMIVSKMANRQLHPLVPILIMLSVLDNFICILTSFFYYFVILTEISFYLRIPIFGIKRVIFISGVFDFFHKAHMRLCQEACKEGTYVIAGVVTDEDVLLYKLEKPIMTYSQRCEAVQACGYVDEVIKTPLYLKGEEGEIWTIKLIIYLYFTNSLYFIINL